MLSGGADADEFVLEPEIGPDNTVTDFENDVDQLDLTAFDFEDFSQVENTVSDIEDGIELTLNTRVKEVKLFKEDPVPHVETHTSSVDDSVTLEGMEKSAFDSNDVVLVGSKVNPLGISNPASNIDFSGLSG